MEYIILPAIALPSKDILKKQEEMADMLFTLLQKQRQWMLIYMILNKCATALVPCSQNLPTPLQRPLQSLLLPENLQLPKVAMSPATSLHLSFSHGGNPFKYIPGDMSKMGISTTCHLNDRVYPA